MRRNNSLFMILLRLSIALIVGTVAYFGIKDIRQNMDRPDDCSTAQSEAETNYDFAQDEFI